jgi:phenazine biosynthesis protein PhzF family
MKNLIYHIVDAFTSQPFGGNPAGVVILEGNTFPEEDLMLKIAAELRYSETAFVVRHSEKEYTVRYFTPKAEVDLCGHATIATFALLHSMKLASGPCLCHTKAGNLAIEVGEQVMMQMATPKIVETIEDSEDIYRALGFDGSTSNSKLQTPKLPVQIVSTGLPDFMIQVSDVATLNSLQPDMDAVSAITKKHDAVSFHVFAFGDDGHTAHVRDFAPLYDIPEESATGTANAALTHYLSVNGVIPAKGDFLFLQGEAMRRPSVIMTRISENSTVYVGGCAYILAKGEFI